MNAQMNHVEYGITIHVKILLVAAEQTMQTLLYVVVIHGAIGVVGQMQQQLNAKTLEKVLTISTSKHA